MNLFAKLFGSKVSAPPRRLTWRPQLEVLEGRMVPAGNIVSTFFPGTDSLLLSGDSTANQLRITKDPATPDRIRVEALSGTSLNGVVNGTASYWLNLFGARMDLDMKEGNDSVTMDVVGFSPGFATRIDLGTGDNRFEVDHLQLRNTLTVLGGDGIDSVFVPELLSYGLAVRTGRGDDTILLGNVEVRGHAVFDTGAGADFLSNALKILKPQGVRIWGELRVDLGSARQDTAADGMIFAGVPLQVDNKTSILTGGGSDQVELGGLDAVTRATLQDVTIETSAGDDVVLLTSLRGRDLQLDGGTGSNRMSVGDFAPTVATEFYGPVTFTGQTRVSTTFTGNNQILLRRASFATTFHYESTGPVGLTTPTTSYLAIQGCYFGGESRFDLGDGLDMVYLQRPSLFPEVGATIFNGRVTFNLGRGNDRMAVGHYTDTSHPVTFRGRVVYQGGGGTDLIYGFSPNPGTIVYGGARSQIGCALLDAPA